MTNNKPNSTNKLKLEFKIKDNIGKSIILKDTTKAGIITNYHINKVTTGVYEVEYLVHHKDSLGADVIRRVHEENIIIIENVKKV